MLCTVEKPVKFKTCKNCPDHTRNRSCRETCAGWRYRERRNKQYHEIYDRRRKINTDAAAHVSQSIARTFRRTGVW